MGFSSCTSFVQYLLARPSENPMQEVAVDKALVIQTQFFDEAKIILEEDLYQPMSAAMIQLDFTDLYICSQGLPCLFYTFFTSLRALDDLLRTLSDPSQTHAN